MIDPAAVWAVLRFQGARSMTASRGVWFVMIALFPPAITALILWSVRHAPPEEAWATLGYGLIACLSCMLGVFLWATPVLQAEIEGKTWTYVAVRPSGPAALLLGNYLIAVAWATTAGLIALTLMVWLCTTEQPLRLWTAIARLVVLSSISYAALYLFLGVLFNRRAMLVAVVYTLLVEVMLGFLPAFINQLTIQYRLRALWIDGMGWASVPPGFDGPTEIFSVAPAWWHVTILLTLSAGLVVLSLAIARRRELPLGAESDF
ncbi:MAG TPA: hypothetical protein VIY86_11715 [Pirellulaceae bacterium]